MPPVLERLLILQARDRRRVELEGQLRAIPADVVAVERRIDAERKAIDEAKLHWQQLETRKKLLETEVAAAEQRVGRYRTQQLEVRKNDEYRALGHEIETVEGEISRLEEEEIGVLYEIEAAKKRFAAAEAELKANIAGHESRIRTLRERERELGQELASIRSEVAAARLPLEEPVLRLYDRIAVRHLPACVPLKGGKCGGCHLKVSSEVESASRGRFEPGTQLPVCDQCGRIVWWEPAG